MKNISFIPNIKVKSEGLKYTLLFLYIAFIIYVNFTYLFVGLVKIDYV